MAARHIQNTASQAVRTATALRNLAEHSGIERDDSALLRKSAQILESFGKIKRAEAKKAKRAEVEREAFVIKATSVAAAMIDNWPRNTLVEQIALIRTHSEWGFASLTRDGGLDAEHGIRYHLKDALRDIPKSLAYRAHSTGRPIEELMDAARGDFDRWCSALLIRNTAEQLQAKIDAPARRAA